MFKLGLKPDFAAHFFDKLFDDKKTKSGTRRFAGDFFGTEEASEDFFLIFFGDAVALVGDVGDDHFFVFDDVGDVDGA